MHNSFMIDNKLLVQDTGMNYYTSTQFMDIDATIAGMY